MTEIENPATIVSGVIALGVTIVGGIWKFGRELAAAEKRIDKDAEDREKMLIGLIDRAESRFGETVSAVKEHASQIRLDLTRDYVTKSEFSDDINSLKSDMKDEFRRIHDKLDRAAEWRAHLSRGEAPE